MKGLPTGRLRSYGHRSRRAGHHPAHEDEDAREAAFSTVLTHYRIWLWGRCITYAATVKGAVAFHLT